MCLWCSGVVVNTFDFHRRVRILAETTNNKMPLIKPTCHPYEVGKWLPVSFLGLNCGKEWRPSVIPGIKLLKSGALPYPLQELMKREPLGRS